MWVSARKLFDTVVVTDWFKYSFVGSTTVVIDLGLLIVLKQVFHVNTILAATVSYWVGVFYNFFLNRHWTFEAGGKGLHRHMWRYGVLLVINYLVAIGFIAALGLVGVNYAIAKVIAIIVSMSWTYLALKKLIFI